MHLNYGKSMKIFLEETVLVENRKHVMYLIRKTASSIRGNNASLFL